MKLIKKILVLSFLFGIIFCNAQGNPSNDYDYIGERHNVGLGYFFGDFNKGADSLTQSQMCGYLGKRFELSETDLAKAMAIWNDTIYKQASRMQLANCISFLRQEGLISPAVQSYLNQIANILDSYKENEYDFYYGEIVALESQIQSDAHLSQDDKNILMTATSTARYSVRFWIDNMSNIEPSVRCCQALINIGGADVAGAVSGAVVSAGVGTMVLPVIGTVAGWVGGGILGGVGGSVFQGVTELWNWLWN
jgi:hypothetical protein